MSNTSQGYLQVLGTSSTDTSPCVSIVCDTNGYLINCGEGLQRFCTEHKVKLVKIQQVFLTNISATTVGGLPGMALTIDQSGTTLESSDGLTVHGPGTIEDYVRDMRPFYRATAIKTRVPQADVQVCFQDRYIEVTSLVLRPEKPTEETSASPQASPEVPERAAKRAKVGPPLPLPVDPSQAASTSSSSTASASASASSASSASASASALSDLLARIPGSKQAAAAAPEPAPPSYPGAPLREHFGLCYIVHTHATPGKFDANKAHSLGLKAGPKFGSLKKGLEVTVDATDAEGNLITKVIKTEDVCGAPEQGKSFAVVDCRSLAEVPSLLDHEGFKPYFSDAVKPSTANLVNSVDMWTTVPRNFDLDVMVHMASYEIVSSSSYMQWMQRFGSKTKHVMLNSTHARQSITFTSQFKVHKVLSQCSKDLFPDIFIDGYNKEANGAPIDIKTKDRQMQAYGSKHNLDVVSGAHLWCWHFAPFKKMGVDTSQIPSLESTTEQASSPRLTEWLAKSRARSRSRSPEPQLADTDEQLLKLEEGDSSPYLVFLGTGSMMPSKYRNVSGIFLNADNGPGASGGGMLLDCGEGTLGQLARCFGVQGARDVIGDLSCVWISHIHADHQLGLLSILEIYAEMQKKKKNPKKLLLVGPTRLKQWAQSFGHTSGNDALSSSFDFVLNKEISDPSFARARGVLERTGMKSMHNVHVVHCYDSWGLVLEHHSGWKLVYSGDTMACPELVEAGKDATVLIHEATFETGMEDEAKMKKHSTVNQAVRAGIAMNAERIVLTHFSQRYPKLPSPANYPSAAQGRVLIAFDLMQVMFSRLRTLTHQQRHMARAVYLAEEVVDDDDDDEDDAHKNSSKNSNKNPNKNPNKKPNKNSNKKKPVYARTDGKDTPEVSGKRPAPVAKSNNSPSKTS